jgi:hypothetical protein
MVMNGDWLSIWKGTAVNYFRKLSLDGRLPGRDSRTAERVQPAAAAPNSSVIHFFNAVPRSVDFQDEKDKSTLK